MPKLSDYVNANPHLAVCIESAWNRNGSSGAMIISFENRLGTTSYLRPYDFGLPAVVSKFDREGEAGYTTVDLLLTMVLFGALFFDGFMYFRIIDTLKELPITVTAAIAAAVGF